MGNLIPPRPLRERGLGGEGFLRVLVLLLLAAVSVWWYFYSLPPTLFATTHSHLLLDRDGKLLSAHIAAD
ncbi:MAG: hypothetical protein BWK73_52005, partial [Thiothrix lacustris]